MKNKIMLYSLIILFSLIYIIIDKYIILTNYGFLELIIYLVSFTLIIFCTISLYKLLKIPKFSKVILGVISILVILWFCLLSVDYKRHRHLYQPLFDVIGYDIVQEYDMDIMGSKVYKNKSIFYLFGIKINEVNAIE